MTANSPATEKHILTIERTGPAFQHDGRPTHPTLPDYLTEATENAAAAWEEASVACELWQECQDKLGTCDATTLEMYRIKELSNEIAFEADAALLAARARWNAEKSEALAAQADHADLLQMQSDLRHGG